MQIINGYEVAGELTTQNSGFARWGRCTKDGYDYFVKEFLSPVYPQASSGLSADALSRRRRQCEEFYDSRREFYNALSQCRTGNNIVVYQFFRYGPKYYAITDWVEPSSIDVRDVAGLDERRRLALVRVLLRNVMSLHEHGVVHADLKLDNLIFKETRDGYMTAKLIDFDSGFLIGKAPKEMQGDLVYMAPETYLAMNGATVPITPKIDVFAMGLLVHQLWTGSLPQVGSRYNYAFEAVLNGEDVRLDARIPREIQLAIRRMLSREPVDRPMSKRLFHLFGEVGVMS